MTSAPSRRVEPLVVAPDVVLTVPGSKSITNRALVCAALADGTSVLDGFGASDDTAAMVACLSRLGVDTDLEDDRSRAVLTGTGGRLRPGPVELDTRLAGTTSRFITAVTALGRGRYRIDGAPGLRARPMGPLHVALSSLGCAVQPEGPPGHLPVVIETAGLRGGTVSMPGDVSSQFLSALLLVAPATTEGIEIRVTTPLVSRPYLDITAAVMGAFGASATVGDDRLAAPPGRYLATDYRIEPDASSAAYLWAAAAITGGRVGVAGFGETPLQGDVSFVDLLARMGAAVRARRREHRGPRPRPGRGIEVDMAGCSDLVPTLAVVAAFAASPTRITGVGFIRTKETDRLAAVVTELRRCGVDAEEEPDGLVVRPPAGGPHGARIRTYGDHRMAMAFALVGLRVPGIEIEDPSVVDKSFPGFWTTLEALRTGGH